MMNLVGKRWSDIPTELRAELLKAARLIDRQTGFIPIEGGECIVDFDSGLNAGSGEWLCIDGYWNDETNEIKIYSDNVFYNPLK